MHSVDISYVDLNRSNKVLLWIFVWFIKIVSKQIPNCLWVISKQYFSYKRKILLASCCVFFAEKKAVRPGAKEINVYLTPNHLFTADSGARTSCALSPTNLALPTGFAQAGINSKMI